MSRTTLGRTARLHMASRRAEHVVASLIVMCAFAKGVAAQATPPLVTGTRVRVVIPAADGQPDRYVIGPLVRWAGDTVVIAVVGPVGPEAQAVALGGGRRLEVRTSSRGHGGKGAGIGAFVGGATGAIIGSATWQPCRQTGLFACVMYPSQGEQAMAGALVGAAGGALVGLVIGISHRTEMWTPVQSAGARVAVTPQGVGLRISF